jgi:hypothetical protein
MIREALGETDVKGTPLEFVNGVARSENGKGGREDGKAGKRKLHCDRWGEICVCPRVLMPGNVFERTFGEKETRRPTLLESLALQ